MKICVLIPTYNESKTIAGLVKQIRGMGLDVIVVDDGSQDDTSKIAQDSGAIVLRNQDNKGKGASLIKGFGYVLNNGFDAVITMDGDGQHLPEDLPSFIRIADVSGIPVLIGNRMSSPKNMPALRIVTNRLMSWFISGIAKQKIYDTQCGLRLIKKEVLEKIKLTTRNYETESEILIKSARLGFKIESIPIKTVYRDEKSKINPFIDALRFIKFIFRELWNTPR